MKTRLMIGVLTAGLTVGVLPGVVSATNGPEGACPSDSTGQADRLGWFLLGPLPDEWRDLDKWDRNGDNYLCYKSVGRAESSIDDVRLNQGNTITIVFLPDESKAWAANVKDNNQPLPDPA